MSSAGNETTVVPDEEDNDFDPQLALQRAGHEREIAIAVASMFLDHVATWQQELTASCSQQDWTTLRRVAHTLKTSGDNLGCLRVREKGKALEILAASLESPQPGSDLAALQPAVAALQQALYRCLPALQEFISGSECP